MFKKIMFSLGSNFDGIAAAFVTALILETIQAALIFALAWGVGCFILEQMLDLMGKRK